MVIQIDSREKGNKAILDYFNQVGQKYIVSKMYAGDYQDVNSVKVLIDKKDSLVELAGNLCRATEHCRVKKEIAKAYDVGCERFIFLIADKTIMSVDEVHEWKVPTRRDGSLYTKVRPEILEKIMKTMVKKYGVEFIFCKKAEIGKEIVRLLEDERDS